MPVSDKIVQLLEELGVYYVFGVAGSTTVSLITSISGSDQIKFITSLNENVSLAMADGYSRTSGKIGVVLLHTTPGLATALPNLYNAYVDHVRLLILVGDVNSKSLIKEPGLSLERIEDLAKPISKWSYYAKSTSDVFVAMKRSAGILNSPGAGPCCIVIPEDIMEEKLSDRNESSSRISTKPVIVNPDLQEIGRLVSAIDKSDWPVLIVGREVKSDSAVKALVEFCNLIAVPVLLESPYPSAYTVGFPQNDPCYMGLFRREAECLKKTDLVIGLGGQLVTERKYYAEDPFNSTTKITHISSDIRQLGKNIKTDTSIVADPEITAMMLSTISKELEPNRINRDSRRSRMENLRLKKKEEMDSLLAKNGEENGIKPWRLVQALKESLRGEDYIIVDEGVVASSYLSELFVFSKPGSLVGRSAGCLGWGVGAAIGAKLALPEKKVIAFVGDGTLMFSPQGIWSAARFKVPITIIVCNNSGYSSVGLSLDSYSRRANKKVNDDDIKIEEPSIEISKLGQSLGADSVSISSEVDLLSKIKKALSSNTVSLLDVKIDPDERGYENSIGNNSSWT
jgi:benzoylformate decarboxylase